MRAFVAVTDRGWYDFLSAAAAIDDINFWQPRPTGVTAKPGAPWLFKLHYPDNAIAGVGFFSYYTVLPLGIAWDYFGIANGVASLDEMIRKCARYRQEPTTQLTDIGCVILSKPEFFDPSEWVPSPRDWSKHIVKGKYYETDEGAGAELWEAVWTRLQTRDVSSLIAAQPQVGAPRIIVPRLGQGGFRSKVTDAYDRRCAVTGERTLPALEAAHIKPFSLVQAHEVRNGLLLRSDLHRLFDQGYVTVTPDHRFVVSKRIKEEWENGRDYYALHGREIRIPVERDDRPDREALEWHATQRYRD